MGAQIREDRISVHSQSVDLASVAANVTAEQSITIPGLRTTDIVLSISGLTQTASLSVSGWRVSAANTLSVFMGNFTGSPIDQGAVTATFVIMRPEKVGSVLDFG